MSPYFDPHLAARVKPVTIGNYQKAAANFSSWAARHFEDLNSEEQWDAALAAFSRDPDVQVTKAMFTSTVAAVGFYFPRYRGRMATSKAILDGWGMMEPTRHTVPLCKTPAKLLACHMVSRGKPRMALAIVLQTHTGLRPGELLAVEPSHIVFPDEAGAEFSKTPVVIALGVKAGTKVKRAQVAKIFYKDAVLAAILRMCRDATPPGCRLFPFTQTALGDELKLLDALLQFDARWTPHSGRAGFATDSRLEGMSFEEVREAGRWAADNSLRTYLDVQAAANVLVQARLSGKAPALAWAARHWQEYFAYAQW